MCNYGGDLRSLRPMAEKILREELGGEVELRWMEERKGRREEVTVKEYEHGPGVQYSDGSRFKELTTAVTTAVTIHSVMWLEDMPCSWTQR